MRLNKRDQIFTLQKSSLEAPVQNSRPKIAMNPPMYGLRIL